MRKFINSLGNLFMPWLLRSPLHFFASGSILLITFAGRKSAKVYTTPVQYARIEDHLIVFTRRKRIWWKNLRGGAPVIVRVRGRDLQATATISTADEDEALMPAPCTRACHRSGRSRSSHNPP
ncbi:MAG: nitroreductase/quinone reductase family protein [Anaerolineae bacterium]|nr:nitroreductase/quinone reductase family protein [Anaerolineae bacterium]